MSLSAAGPRWNSGSTSSTTRYWFDLREDRRDQALAEGVVERVVDRGRRDAETAGGRAVELDVGLQAAVLQVARDVGELRRLPQPVRESCASSRELSSRIDGFDRELILRAADAVLDGQVLHRLHVERDAVDRRRASAAGAG